MGSITVRGLISNTYLERGQVETVEDTDLILNLIDQGYIEKVKPAQLKAEQPAISAPAETDSKPEPSRGASTADWLSFIEWKNKYEGAGVVYDDTFTRSALQEAWDTRPETAPVRTDDSTETFTGTVDSVDAAATN